MKKTSITFLFLLFLMPIFKPSYTHASTIVSGSMNNDTEWSKEGNPYIISGEVYLYPNINLKIDPGVIVNFNQNGSMDVSGNLLANGTSDNPISFITSQTSSNSALINIFNNSSSSISNSSFTSIPGNVFQVYNSGSLSISSSTFSRINGTSISLFNNGKVSADNISILDSGNNPAVLNYNNDPAISSLSISNSTISRGGESGILVYNSASATISNSTISHFINNGIVGFSNALINIQNSSINSNGAFGISMLSTSTINAIQNWWGDASGPYNNLSNTTGTGNKVSDGVFISPWLTSDPFQKSSTTTICCSNVVFLPGIEGSRLYTNTTLGENQLWEPSSYQSISKLFLNPDGTSVNNIYTKDLIKHTNTGFNDFDVYKGLSDTMDFLVKNNTINAWEPLPYDWRLDLGSLVQNGTKLPNNQIENFITEIENQAKNSKTGKVTIIAHSNGGLLAKVLIEELQKENKSDLIDKLILVASPQLGTPESIASAEHGEKLDFFYGLILDKSGGRNWVVNMPATYNLLPSNKYFSSVSTPPIVFDPSIDTINNFRKYYGNAITSYNDLKDFLLALRDSRTLPSGTDLNNPNVLNSVLLNTASSTHADIDNWIPPSNIEVTQIAGWGIPTISGIKYLGKEQCLVASVDCSYILDHEPLHTIDGDGTVVSPSATVLNVKTYYANLRDYNKNYGANISHASIFQNFEINSLIGNIIEHTTSTIPYITDVKPGSSISKTTEISVHSPVDIDIYDSNGNHTGKIQNPNPNSDLQMVEENIPNSVYEEVGEGKYVSIDSGNNSSNNYTINLQGTDAGTFTLDTIQKSGDNEVASSTFVDIPVTINTTATLNLASSTPQINLDEDGDGKTDAIIAPSSNLDPIIFLQLMEKQISTFSLNKKTEESLDKRIDGIILLLQKGKIKNASKQITRFDRNLETRMKNHKKKSKFSTDEISQIIELLNQLLDTLSS